MTRVALPQVQPENNAWKQLLGLEELERISLSDAEKLTQVDGEMLTVREKGRDQGYCWGLRAVY